MQSWRVIKACVMAILLIVLTISNHAQSAAVQDDFHWVPWLNAGEVVWQVVLRANPTLKDVIGDGARVAVAVTDLNYNGQNDLILHFWDPAGCGADGCPFVILMDNARNAHAYLGHSLTRTGYGVDIDGRYYKL